MAARINDPLATARAKLKGDDARREQKPEPNQAEGSFRDPELPKKLSH